MYGCPPDEPDQQKRFRAVLTALDDAIGRLLRAVDDLALRERTIVLLISDNGAFMLPGRGLEVQATLPLRSGGVTTCEGGVRVPAMVRWPGRIQPGSVCREMLSSLDVLPTIVSAASGSLPAERVIDGCDAAPVLAGQATSPHPALHWVWNQGKKEQWRGMRAGNIKILRRADNEPWQLYDLSSDLAEANDLASKQPGRLNALVAQFEAWRASIKKDPTRGLNAQAD